MPKRLRRVSLFLYKIDPGLLDAFRKKCEIGKRPYMAKIKDLIKDYLDS